MEGGMKETGRIKGNRSDTAPPCIYKLFINLLFADCLDVLKFLKNNVIQYLNISTFHAGGT